MQTPLQITFRNFPRSDAVEARIRDKAAKLEEFHPRIMSCHVVVEELDRHHHQGRQFTVRLDIRVPGHEVVVDRDHHEDIYVALRDAFNAAGRKLEEIVRTQRGDIKAHDVPQHGKVTRLFADEGYGFIEAADGREFYFSRDNVVEPSFDRIKTGAAVQFVEDVAADGRQHATRVSAGKHHPLAG
jgi:ribosome-associated translation inhibitor RaiA